VEDEIYKELKALLLRGMACRAALIIVLDRCLTATSISLIEQLPSKHCVFRGLTMSDWKRFQLAAL
jgi:hypothetical protein